MRLVYGHGFAWRDVHGAHEHDVLDAYCTGRRRALGAEELHRQPRVQKAQRDAVLTAVGLGQLQLVWRGRVVQLHRPITAPAPWNGVHEQPIGRESPLQPRQVRVECGAGRPAAHELPSVEPAAPADTFGRVAFCARGAFSNGGGGATVVIGIRAVLSAADLLQLRWRRKRRRGTRWRV
jgi:hypothetical protein